MSNENPSSDTGSSSPKLLFVHSGSPKKRLAFEAASALGIHIYLFNPGPSWADDYTKQSFYTRGRSLSEILSLAADLHEQVHLDGVVTFWEEDVPTCACISQHLGLPGNSVTAAMNARSKYHMREAFQQAGVPVPSFRLITDEESLENACREIGLPAVLKPEWGADSEWVTRVDTVEQALERYREIRHVVRIQDSIYPYPPTRFLLEGFLSGPEVSVEGVMQNGNVTLYAIIDKAKMSESFFIERGECTPSRFPAQVQEDIRDMVTRGAAALGLVNSGIHAEVKITPDGPRLVEIGARMGGDCIQPLVKRVYGIDLAVENINAAMGWPVHPPTPANGCGISSTLVPDRPGRVDFKPLKNGRRSENLIEIVLTKNPGDAVLVPPLGYDNLAWISVWGKDYRSAKKRLSHQSSRLESTFVIQPDVSIYHDLQVAD